MGDSSRGPQGNHESAAATFSKLGLRWPVLGAEIRVVRENLGLPPAPTSPGCSGCGWSMHAWTSLSGCPRPREGGRSRAPGGAAQGGRHRRVKVLRKDWRFQVASLGEEWWVNKVGTYGMASAQSYWGRLAALLLRVLYALFPQVDWNFVFVDDFLWLLRSKGAVNLAVALLATLLALGTPLSWKKTHLAEVNTWLGFVVDHGGRAGDALKGHREGPGPHPMVNCCMSAGEVDASATVGLENGHHHGGETP